MHKHVIFEHKLPQGSNLLPQRRPNLPNLRAIIFFTRRTALVPNNEQQAFLNLKKPSDPQAKNHPHPLITLPLISRPTNPLQLHIEPGLRRETPIHLLHEYFQGETGEEWVH